ncbi:MAG: bifunctional [glutamate--ammonia ligase]-adenylyl-L-tyrosine phosphorylase/[glutamate--ammonia-ligase] adenylyltransferase [Sandaracinaceae bacterium]
MPRSPEAEDALAVYAERGGDASNTGQADAVAWLADHAPSLLGLVRSDPSIIPDVLARPIEHGSDRETLGASLARALSGRDGDSAEVRRALRRFRHRAIVRIALREIRRVADVEQTSAEMAWLAAVVIDAALDHATRTETARHGRALTRDGAGAEVVVPLTVLGMGKLGGLELNLGSDVDLCFFYETDDAEVEGGELTVNELYARVAKRCTEMIGEVTEDGFCFRVDLRLRPEGTRGPLVNSLASAERYYESWGRTWERAALLRARAIAGDRRFGAQLLETLRPFIFRRAVDPSLAEAMHEMLLRSRRELRVDEERDVKLGKGGIREAEFFVQTLQLVWGGRHTELQVAGTLEALWRLRGAGLVSDREAETLADGWALLRRVEHRVHVWTGYQTHRVPDEPRFAESLGYADLESLEAALGRVREGIAGLFSTLLPGETPTDRDWDALGDLVADGAEVETIAEALAQRLPVRDPYESAAHLARLGRRAAGPLGPVTWQRLPQLGRRLLEEVAHVGDPDTALRLLADFFNRLGGPWAYERLLLEEPRLTRRLIGLFGASPTLSSALIGHPEDVDLLLVSGAPRVEELVAPHDALLAELGPDPDPEEIVRELRRLKRTGTLRTGLAYVAGELDLEGATERLSALAEGQVRVSLEAARRWAERRWGRAARGGLLVCAMGKLGGRELGFGGDLDLVFLFGEEGETEPTESGRSVTHGELFARMAQRTMQLLRQRDAEGPGYETDTRLRPSGSKGTLVVSLAGFDAYHEKGAADWERQALVRARPLAGDPEVARAAQDRFDALAYLRGPTPGEELARVRGRLQTELGSESPERYHPKLGYGGLVDVELCVQWLQMRHGDDARVRSPSTPDAIRRLRDAGAIADVDADALSEAQTFFRKVELALKLFDEHRDPLLEPRGRTGAHVARSLGVRARDGLSPTEALDETYRRHARAARRLFEREVGEVQAPAPWEASGES